MQSNHKKICIVTHSLGNGGAERSAAILSQIFSKLGYQVHIVTVLNIIDYPYAGKLLNLGVLKDLNNGFFGRFKRLRHFIKYLKKNQFDYIIENRTRKSWLKELLITRFIYKPYRIIGVVRSYQLSNYFPKYRFAARYVYQNTAAIVSVSYEIQEAIETTYGFKNVTTIHDPATIPLKTDSSAPPPKTPYILAYGRLDERTKNYSLLFEAYQHSELHKAGVTLVVMGSGPDLELLKQRAAMLQIQCHVQFISYQKKPFEVVANAKFVCLSSHFEGCPRVLIEALSLGTPVVAVNCKSGPKEIIKHEINGLLVENYNPKMLAEAMNRFIFDQPLYNHCKSNAKRSARPFSIKNIGSDWLNLINFLDENTY